MLIEIVRFYESAHVTLGIVCVDGMPVCMSLEEPFRENDSNISRIPPGLYDLDYTYSPTLGSKHPILKDVYGRSYIRIHGGVNVDHTEGCILVGTGFKWANGRYNLTNPADAMRRLTKTTNEFNNCKIRIINRF